jgi:DNA-binding NarL/FixJ family response regulator
MLRVALIDGDEAIRAGRRLMIESQDNLKLIFEESDSHYALAKIPDLLVDVVVIDHRLKGFDGIELSSRLVSAFSEKSEPSPTIIVTGSYATPELVMAAIRCGASDVVTQDAPMSELLRAINNSKAKKTYYDFSSFDEILNHADYKPKTDPVFVLRRSQLNDIEKRILVLLDSGLQFQEVCIALEKSQIQFEKLLEDLLINLHFATYEQLYLALHDAKVA